MLNSGFSVPVSKLKGHSHQVQSQATGRSDAQGGTLSGTVGHNLLLCIVNSGSSSVFHNFNGKINKSFKNIMKYLQLYPVFAFLAKLEIIFEGESLMYTYISLCLGTPFAGCY